MKIKHIQSEVEAVKDIMRENIGMNHTKQKELSKEALVLLNEINKVDLNSLKGFLSKVGLIGYPTREEPRMYPYKPII